MSARRSGCEVWAADRFGDLDLRGCATSVRVENYPAGLIDALAAAPAGPWLYTGALENRPDLIELLAAIRPLCGVGGDVLRSIRDPATLAIALCEQGYETVPRCAADNGGLPLDGSWLVKPRASAGGVGVEPWTGMVPLGGRGWTEGKPRRRESGASLRSSPGHPRAKTVYWQQRIDGLPVAAIYLAAGGGAELLGVTRQLLGEPWCGLEREADRFRYCGSLGPLTLSPRECDQFIRLGNSLAAAFPLVGLIGVDAVLNAEGVWPVEVNPRYTASVEVLERALGIEAIRGHFGACGQWPVASGQRPATGDEKPVTHQFCGKAILFARRAMTISPEFMRWSEHCNAHQAWPTIADISEPGTQIARGQPIVTLLADGPDEQAVVAQLQGLAGEAESRLATA